MSNRQTEAGQAPGEPAGATVRILKATIAHLMARLSVHEVELPTFCADGFQGSDLEVVRLPGIYKLVRKIHVPEEAGS